MGVSRLVLLSCVLSCVLCVLPVDGLSFSRLRSVTSTAVTNSNVLQASTHISADFFPPQTRLCVMYTYDLKHDDDSNFREHQPNDVGQLPDGTTYGKNIFYQIKATGFAPCVLVSLEGDLLNRQGKLLAKFKTGGQYPSPPCLGATTSGLFGTKNSAGNSCTPVKDANKVWTNNQVTWYPSPTAIPPQAALQKPAVAVAPSQLPRQRLCVFYDYNLRHDDDSYFPEYISKSQYGVLADGTTWGKDIRNHQSRVGPCIFVNLEGDRLDNNGKVISKFKTDATYPNPPCLGLVKQGLFGGDQNTLGHSCTRPVGADEIWIDNGNNAEWYPTPADIPQRGAARRP